MILSLLLLVIANLLAAYAIYAQFFFLLCLSSFLLGISAAALSQLRFAAMEMVPQNLQAGAASMVLFGGIVAANLGPELGLASSEYFAQIFVGSYVAMAVLAFCAVPFLWPLQARSDTSEKTAAEKISNEKNKTRSVRELLVQPTFLVAVSAAAVAYAVMSFIMTATPISMHEHFGHSLADTKWVIQSHISAMFLPSLFSAWLIKKLGQKNMMLTGLLAFVLTLLIGFIDQGLWAFWIALLLLGIGWNFLFVSATVLLPQTHKESERFIAQGFNDSVVFSVQAFVAVSSGILLSILGWQWMLLMALPLILWQAYLLFFKYQSSY
jgi:predicted MFS family arabinose efflux permease